jgi:hypothetical protein
LSIDRSQTATPRANVSAKVSERFAFDRRVDAIVGNERVLSGQQLGAAWSAARW